MVFCGGLGEDLGRGEGEKRENEGEREGRWLGMGGFVDKGRGAERYLRVKEIGIGKSRGFR